MHDNIKLYHRILCVFASVCRGCGKKENGHCLLPGSVTLNNDIHYLKLIYIKRYCKIEY